MNVKFIFGFVYNLSISATHEQIEHAYQTTYRPFIKSLYKAKHLKCVLYIPGNLLAWLEKNHPEYIQVTKSIIAQKRLELLGGGYYDPLFSLIPRTDCIEQIEYSSTLISKLYNKRPQGVWLNRLYWEQSYVSILNACDIKYIFLKDSDRTDYNPADINCESPITTEEFGKIIRILPLNSRLFDVWRLGKPRKFIAHIQEYVQARAHRSQYIIALIDDTDPPMPIAAIDRCISVLKQNVNWLETIRPTEILPDQVPLKTKYFYSRGIYTVKSTLVNYSEQSLLYAKMQYTHKTVNQIRGDKFRKRLARELLLQSQNHYGYWEANSSISDLAMQQKKSYRLLIEAEQIAHQHQKNFRPGIVSFDYDFDGIPEYLYQSGQINAYVHRIGGALFELDYLPSKWNWIDIVPDKRSTYTKRLLNINRERAMSERNACLDHIIPPKTTVNQYFKEKNKSNYLQNTLYTFSKIDHEHSTLELETVWNSQNNSTAWNAQSNTNGLLIGINKKYRFSKNTIVVDYLIRNDSHKVFKALFATQLNINPSLLHYDKIQLNYVDAAEKKYTLNINTPHAKLAELAYIEINCSKNKHMLLLDCSGSDELWYYSAVKKQIITLMPFWHINLGPQDRRSLQIKIQINKLRRVIRS